MSAPTFAKPGMHSIPLYQPDVDDCAIDLSDNTNLWGASPAAVNAIQEMSAANIARYPSIYSERLRPAILDYVGLSDVDGVSVVAGCGSDDVIDSTMRAFGAAGDSVAFCAPTFSMIPTFARLNGLQCESIPLTPTYDIDAEQLVDCNAKITYVCTPNNPTATSASRSSIDYVVANAHGIVMIDSAYAEFAGDPLDDLVRSSDRVIVAHTFSKAFGLAGLRMGYGVGASTLVDLVARARGPYKVNAVAERAVAASLDDTPHGLQWVKSRAFDAVANRERFSCALREIGLVPMPSAANFLMVPSSRSVELFNGLRERGILVRLMRSLPQDLPALAASSGNALRIGVGPWEMMDALLVALQEVFACA